MSPITHRWRFFVRELKLLFLFMSLVNPRANLRQMEGRKSFFEVVSGVVRVVCAMVGAGLSSAGFEVVLFFRSVAFFIKICHEEIREGRGFVYQMRAARRALNVRVLAERLKRRYTICKFYLDLFMLSFVFTPNELEKILLPKGKKDFFPGDYVAKVHEWYKSQSGPIPRTFMEFLEDNLKGEVYEAPFPRFRHPDGYSSVYEEEARKQFLWIYRHFFSIWTRFGD